MLFFEREARGDFYKPISSLRGNFGVCDRERGYSGVGGCHEKLMACTPGEAGCSFFGDQAPHFGAVFYSPLSL